MFKWGDTCKKHLRTSLWLVKFIFWSFMNKFLGHTDPRLKPTSPKFELAQKWVGLIKAKKSII